MDTQTLQDDLLELIILLQGLNPQHLATVAQFLRHRPEDLLLGQLGELLRDATSAQVDRLVTLTSSTNAQPPPGVAKASQAKAEDGEDGDNQHPHGGDGDATSAQDKEAIDKLPKEMVASFGLLVQVYQLYQLLNRLSILQLMKIFEFVPPGPQVQQLQLLQQLQQLLGQLLPETLASLHQELASADAGREQTVLSQLLQLRKEHFHLYQPLRMLLQLDLDDLLALQDALPRLQPVQMLQLLALLQLQPFDVLELKRILHESRLTSNHDSLVEDLGSLLPPPTSATAGPTGTAAAAGLPALPQAQQPQPLGLGGVGLAVAGAPPTPHATPAPPVPHAPRARPLLRIVEQPPEKSVYKRNLKPNPTLQLVEEELGMESNLYIAPVLIRCDTLEEKNKLLTGNKPVKVAPGRVVSFRRLKIMATSHQQGESLFAIRFELRRYHGNEYEILDYVQSNPVCVLSHSTQLRPVSSMTPSVTEVIPYSGTIAGGTRVAVLGTNFVDSPSARVRFDNIDVMPVFHGPRTLICTTPPHHSGIVSVRVSNDSKLWSPTAASFTYEERSSTSTQTSSTSSRPNFDFGLDDSDIAQAAWQGSPDLLRSSVDSSGGEAVNAPDARGFTALHIAAAGGDCWAVELLLASRADVSKRDLRGNAALHWAAGFGHQQVVELLLRAGADPNAANQLLETPLHWASAAGKADVCSQLLLSGAHCFASAIEGDTPLHRAVVVDHSPTILTLLQHGAPADLQDDEGDTPLHYALREGRASAVAVLLEHGADPSLPNCDLESPLHYASLVDVDIVHGLLKAGAQLCASDATEATALHWAAEVGAGAVLTALLEAGAKTEARDIFGHMALAYALDCGAEEVVSPLLYSAASDMDSILSLHLDSACALDKGDSDDETYASDTDFDAADTEDSAGHLDTGPSFAFGESCHGWASRAMPMTLPPLNFAPFGLSDLSTSPSSSFAAFAPVAPGSPAAASSGFFPPLGCSLSMAAF